MQGTLKTKGFHHIALVSRVFERSRAFYGELLGLFDHSATRSEVGGEAVRSLLFGDDAASPGSLLLALHGGEAGPGRPGIGGIHHFALGTESEDSLLRWKRWLMDAGVAVSGPYDRGYFTSIYFRDPDHQVVEIATAGPGYAIDEPAQALGRGIMLPPQRIVAGTRDEAAIAALTHPERVEAITPEMGLTGLHHISGITNDLERAGDFYEEALGLRLVKKTVNRDDPDTPHWFWARYDGERVLENSSFTLFGWPPGWNHTRAGVGQAHHVAFRARDDEELLAWRDHLRTIGVPVADRGGDPSSGAIRFLAPDGLLLEIATDESMRGGR